MNFKRILSLATTMLLAASLAGAQQYHVALTMADGRVTMAEFHACGPDASSECKAIIGRTSRDKSAFHGLTTRAMSPNQHDSLSIENGKLRIKALDGRKPPVVLLGIGNGKARAVVVSPDSRYAFVMVENALENPTDVMMIDLVTQNAVAGVSLDSEVLGMALHR